MFKLIEEGHNILKTNDGNSSSLNDYRSIDIQLVDDNLATNTYFINEYGDLTNQKGVIKHVSLKDKISQFDFKKL